VRVVDRDQFAIADSRPDTGDARLDPGDLGAGNELDGGAFPADGIARSDLTLTRPDLGARRGHRAHQPQVIKKARTVPMNEFKSKSRTESAQWQPFWAPPTVPSQTGRDLATKISLKLVCIALVVITSYSSLQLH